MKHKNIFLLLFLVLIPVFAFSQWQEARLMTNMAGVAVKGNNFANDSNCFAVWRFEFGGVTTDSKGSPPNTLTNVNAVYSYVNKYKEGVSSGYFDDALSQCLYISDAGLSSGFPLKNGDSTKKNNNVCLG